MLRVGPSSLASIPWVFLCLLAAGGCRPAPDRLSAADIVESFGVTREQRMTDCLLAQESTPLDEFNAAVFLRPDSFVIFDLGSEPKLESLRLVATPEVVVAAADAAGRFEPLQLHRLEGSGQARVSVIDLDGNGVVRYLRLGLRPGSDRGAVMELGPPTDSSHCTVREDWTFADALERRLVSEKVSSRWLLVSSLLCLVLVVLALRTTGRKQWIVCLVVVLISVAGWTRFGQFQGSGNVLHSWELTHYYLGAKYFPELGYRELYRCLAAHERESGRGALLDQLPIRNLDDYQLNQGGWSATPAGRCRSEFSEARWAAFARDADTIRRTFLLRNLHSTLRDHGYNGTPMQTWLLARIVGDRPASRNQFGWLAAADAAALWLCVVLLWWAFGGPTAAFAALVLAFGDPWAFNWTGGAFARYLWLLFLVGGICALRKKKAALGSGLLMTSGLLRLFPLVFFGGLLVWLLWELLAKLRNRRREVFRRLTLALSCGALIALLLGTLLPLTSYGPTVFASFAEKISLHADKRSTNAIGLPLLFELGSESGWPRWLMEVLQYSTVVASLLLLGWIVCQWVPSWVAVCAAAPLAFVLQPLSSYDMTWLVLLAPLAITSAARVLILGLVVAATNLLPEFWSESQTLYIAVTVIFFIALVGFFLDLVWQLRSSTAGGLLDCTRSGSLAKPR